MKAEGWTPYLMEMPEPDALLRFWDEYNDHRWTGRALDLHPCFNVAYLWWILTGIEKEQERLPHPE
jgi:hypothetical protein